MSTDFEGGCEDCHIFRTLHMPKLREEQINFRAAECPGIELASEPRTREIDASRDHQASTFGHCRIGS